MIYAEQNLDDLESPVAKEQHPTDNLGKKTGDSQSNLKVHLKVANVVMCHVEANIHRRKTHAFPPPQALPDTINWRFLMRTPGLRPWPQQVQENPWTQWPLTKDN